MKLSVFIILSSFYCTSLLAQNTFPENGNAGIGTLTPTVWFGGTLLQIQGQRPVLRLTPNTSNGLGTLLFKGAFSEGTNGSDDEFHINYVSDPANPSIIFGAYKNGPKSVLTLMGAGNVGIGTDTPKERLSVNGNIRAKEIKVEQSNWPDYVFSKTYPLPNLKQLKNYIDLHHHLPDIPTAAEVSEDGVMVGEMTKRLLGKIEELTLYAIDQENHISKLKQENKDLKLVQIEQQKLLQRLADDIKNLTIKFKLIDPIK